MKQSSITNNQNYKICDILGFFWIKNKKFWEVFARSEKKKPF